MTDSFSQMPPDAKVWIYGASRILTADEITALKAEAARFTENWTAHERKVTAAFDVLHGVFLVLMADGSMSDVSGCGIDKSVHFIKRMEEQFNISLFNRLQVELLTSDGMRITDRSGAGALEEQGLINGDTATFDKSVTTRSDFTSRFEIPYRSSWAYSKKPVNAAF